MSDINLVIQLSGTRKTTHVITKISNYSFNVFSCICRCVLISQMEPRQISDDSILDRLNPLCNLRYVELLIIFFNVPIYILIKQHLKCHYLIKTCLLTAHALISTILVFCFMFTAAPYFYSAVVGTRWVEVIWRFHPVVIPLITHNAEDWLKKWIQIKHPLTDLSS